MRILLRNFQTGAFFKSAALWTTDQNEALNFENRAVAVTVSRELRLQNVEIVYVNEEGGPLSGRGIKIDP